VEAPEDGWAGADGGAVGVVGLVGLVGQTAPGAGGGAGRLDISAIPRLKRMQYRLEQVDGFGVQTGPSLDAEPL
jgi:hypothetical protein